jgi:VanZ family protein
MIKTLDIIALILYCALIYWLSDQSSLPVAMLFSFQDKLIHLSAYFIMGILAWRVFRHFFSSRQQLMFAIVAFCSIYGFLDEWHQSFVEGRSADFFDWLADTAGDFLAAYLLTRLFPIRDISIETDGKTVQNS